MICKSCNRSKPKHQLFVTSKFCLCPECWIKKLKEDITWEQLNFK